MTGILEVTLVDAKGLTHKDSVGQMDPYVLIEFKGHTLKSKVAKEHGSNPEWNETFSLWVDYPETDENQYNLILKIMDKDTFSIDDFLGQATINVKDIVVLGVEKQGSVRSGPLKYQVIDNSKVCCGEICVALHFNPKNTG